MTYVPRPEASGDTLSSSRDQIRQNFQLIRDQFEENHVNIQNNGKHKFLQMPEQASAPTTAADEGGLYAKEADSVTNLFWRQESDGTEVQLTTSQAPTDAASGTTFLPGGFLMQWGTFTVLGGTEVTVTFNEAFSATPYSVVCQLDREGSSAQSINIYNISSTEFKVKSSASNRPGYYMAIGTA